MTDDDYIDRHLRSLQLLWEQFIKWHVAFMVINFAALGARGLKDDAGRDGVASPGALVFLCLMLAGQNVTSLMTSIAVRNQTRHTGRLLASALGVNVEDVPFPYRAGVRAAALAGVGNGLLILTWCVLAYGAFIGWLAER